MTFEGFERHEACGSYEVEIISSPLIENNVGFTNKLRTLVCSSFSCSNDKSPHRGNVYVPPPVPGSNSTPYQRVRVLSSPASQGLI